MIKSLAFYRDLLGFQVVSASPEVETREGRFSHWMWLRFGAAELMLNTRYDSNERPDHPPEAPPNHQAAWFYIGCADIDETFQQLTARGLTADPPRLATYGLKRFTVKDPDDNHLVFQEVPQPYP